MTDPQTSDMRHIR